MNCGHAKLNSVGGWMHCTLERGHDSLHGNGDFFWLDEQMKTELDARLAQPSFISMTVSRDTRMIVEFEFPSPLKQAPLEEFVKAAYQRGAQRGHVTLLPALTFDEDDKVQ